jgi:hypothetical protein
MTWVVPSRGLERIADVALGRERESLNRHRRARNVAAELFQFIALMDRRGDARVQLKPGRLRHRLSRGNGTLNTHCRTGTSGSTSSIRSAALSTMRRAPQLGQKPRHLQLKATNFSAWQSVQRTRINPCSRRPHLK